MSKDWYPVINRTNCMECGKCVEKCGNGVYDKSSPEQPKLIYTDGCIYQCHGCGNLCPTGAITYFGENTGWVPPALQTIPVCGCGFDNCTHGYDCSCNGNPATGELSAKNLSIDFLFLDLNICERCIATGDTLEEALKVLAPIFEKLNYVVKVNKVNIETKELAEQYRFVSSPTIRANGIDICTEVKENYCKDCVDLCGESVDCRVFVYDGKDYEKPPAAMIIDGILRALYGQARPEEKPYALPDNLKNYFAGKESIENQGGCCCSGGDCC